MRKRLISALTCFSVLLGAFSPSITFADNSSKTEMTDPDVAYAILGDGVQSQGIDVVKVGPTVDKRNVIERLGKKCWALKRADGLNSERICITLSDEFKAGAKTGDTYEVTVDWYDEGNGGFFYAGYDDYNRSEYELHDMVEEVYTEGDNSWKTSTFYIDDAKFEEALRGGCDLFISTTLWDTGWGANGEYLSEADIPISKITIKKNISVNPIRVSMDTDQTSHTFPWFAEKKIFHNTLINTTDREIEATVNFKAVDDQGYCAYTVTEEMTFAPGEEKNLDTDFSELERCGIYDYVVEVKPQDRSFDERVVRDGFVILKTDPDGIKNDMFYYASAMYLAEQDRREIGFEILEYGNGGGIRGDNGWPYTESNEGEYIFDTAYHAIATGLKERDMNYMPIIWLSNWGKTGNRNMLPDEESEWKAAQKWLDWWMPRIADTYDEYEYWNEPDLKSFCANYTAEGYIRGYRMLLDAVKKYDPGERVAAISFTDIGASKEQGMFNELLELGIAEDIRGNAVSLHGYTRSKPEGALPVGSVKWYQDRLAEHGVSRDEYEMWNTEFGYTIADDVAYHDHKKQGAMVLRSMLEYIENGSFDKYVVYQFEKRGMIKSHREASFGHVSNEADQTRVWGEIYVPTAAYLQTTAYNYLFADSKYEKNIIAENNLKVRLFNSGKFGKKLIEMNTVSGSEVFTLNLGCNSITCFDEYGNEAELCSDDGIYTFNATEYPKYILGNFTKSERVEQDKVSAKLEAEVAEFDEFTVDISIPTDKAYSIEAEDTEQIILLSDSGVKNGKTTLRFKSESGFGTKSKIVLNIKDGDKTVSKLDLYANVVEKAFPNLSITLASKTNLNKWNGVATIKNTSGTDCITGELKIVSPAEFVTKEPIKLGYIPAGKTAELVFNLPDINKKGIQNISYQVELDSGEVIKDDIRIDTSVADYAHKKPQIDGVMSPGEWNLGTAMVTDSVEGVLYSTGWTGATWTGPNDQSAKCYVAWDEEKLYLCWDVTDDIHCQENEGGTVWAGDGVQLGIYYGTHDEFVAAGQAATSFNEIGVSLTKNGPEMYRWSSQGSDHAAGVVDPSKYELAITRNGNKTVYEWAVPWSTLLSGNNYPKEGDKLGFSYLINENDGAGRRGAMRYADGIFFTKDTTQFSYINLIKSEVQN